MYHPRLKGKHYEMGRNLGTIFRKNKVVFPVKLDFFQKKFGKNCANVLKDFFPEAAEEIRGVTDEINFDNSLFASWMMCMGCCLDISSNESIELRGCTAFAFSENGNVFFGRNNDLPPYFRKISKSILYSPENKFRFILNTSSFINGEEGINENGLATAMTFIVPKRDELKPGFNSLFLVRYILENCSDTDEAENALKKIPVASSCNILLADKKGKISAVECNPHKMIFRNAEEAGGRKFSVIANHFIDSEMKKHDGSKSSMFFSFERYATAVNSIGKIANSNGIEFSKDLLSGKYGFICEYPKSLHFSTIWSSVYDVSGGKVFIADGDPRRAVFFEDQRGLFQ